MMVYFPGNNKTRSQSYNLPHAQGKLSTLYNGYSILLSHTKLFPAEKICTKFLNLFSGKNKG